MEQQQQQQPTGTTQNSLLKNYENYFNSVIERLTPQEQAQPEKTDLKQTPSEESTTMEQTQQLASNIDKLAQMVTTLLNDHGPELAQAIGKNIKE